MVTGPIIVNVTYPPAPRCTHPILQRFRAGRVYCARCGVRLR